MGFRFKFPREPYLEFYLNSDWRNLISDVRQNPGIKYERGRGGEQSKPTPSECSFVLDDSPEFGNGDYSPRNPMGQWYPYFTRNVPVRSGLEIADDQFGRTVASGWGDLDTGYNWAQTSIGSVATSVASGTARHDVTVPSGSAFAASYLDDILIRNPDVSVTGIIDGVASITGGQKELGNILLRGQNTSYYYVCRLFFTTSQIARVQLMRLLDNGVLDTTLAGPVQITPTYSGQQWTTRAQIEGNTIRFKAWPTLSVEPLDWQIEYTDIDDAAILDKGWVGIRSGCGTGSSGTTSFRYSNFVLRSPRFAGETSSVVPDNDLTEGTRITKIECGTLFRRLEQGTSPVQSALRRFIPENISGLIGYWPCEDERFSDRVAAGTPDTIHMVLGGSATTTHGGIGNGANTVEFGADDSIACSAPLPHTNLSTFTAYLGEGNTNTGRLDTRFILKVPSPQDPSVFVVELFTRGTAGRWHVQLESDGSISLRAFGAAGILLDDFGNAVIYNTPALWWLQLAQNGANIDYNLSYVAIGADNVTSYTSGSVINQTLGGLFSLGQLSGFENSLAPSDTVIGHMMIGNVQVASGIFFDPLNAFLGESATTRLTRLAAENNLPIIGQCSSDSISADMGPQQVDTLIKLFLECAATDHGIFFDSRGTNAFSYIPLEYLYDQTIKVELNHDLYELAPNFAPADDDAPTVNIVTAKARRGSSVTLIADTGPLNANDPGTEEGAVGVYDKSFDLNPGSSEQLEQSAGWLLHLGTVDEARFPEIAVNYATPALTGNIPLALDVLDLDIGDVLAADNLENWHIYDQVQQLILGYTEIIDTAYMHSVGFNTAPNSPYNVGRLSDGELRLDSSDSSLSDAIDEIDTTFDVTTPHVETRWVVEADEIISGAVVGQGTSLLNNYIIATDSDATDIGIGDHGYLYTNQGILKEATQFTVTAKNSASGFTNVEFSPNAAAVTNSGDIFKAHYAANFPFDIIVGGERMTVTDINLTSDPQQFVVTRSVNGVVKSHLAGAKVQLFKPYWIAK